MWYIVAFLSFAILLFQSGSVFIWSVNGVANDGFFTAIEVSLF